jgi:hypothetical protein
MVSLNLTDFWQARMWLRSYDFQGWNNPGWEGWEIATWADSQDAQQRARVVLGQTGVRKNAWGVITLYAQ